MSQELERRANIRRLVAYSVGMGVKGLRCSTVVGVIGDTALSICSGAVAEILNGLLSLVRLAEPSWTRDRRLAS